MGAASRFELSEAVIRTFRELDAAECEAVCVCRVKLHRDSRGTAKYVCETPDRAPCGHVVCAVLLWDFREKQIKAFVCGNCHQSTQTTRIEGLRDL